MKLHSDVLTENDLYQACPPRVGISQLDPAGSRSHNRAWTVRLTGSSPYMQRGNTGYQAATYDEHGQWMKELFTLDPNAFIADYKGAPQFHDMTQNKFLGADNLHDRLLNGEITPETHMRLMQDMDPEPDSFLGR